jgi:hypothetical protein
VLFLRICPASYTSPEVLDRENMEDGSVELGERCNSDIMHNLQLGRRRDTFKIYFNSEGSVPW